MNREALEGTTARAGTAHTVLLKQQRIATIARKHPGEALTNLHHYIDEEWMLAAYEATRKDGALGIDGQSAEDYRRELKSNLSDLLARIKSGSYRAPAVRRVYIPKDDKQRRPLGIPTFEDKIAQRAILMVLEPVFEAMFSDSSYGFRPGRSAHQALKTLRKALDAKSGNWVIDADIRGYFDAINHRKLRECYRQRVGDGVITKMLDKWLKAGVMEAGQWSRNEAGTPQGGVISPLLANVYLHECLDQWYEQEAKPRLAGRSGLVRFADDFVIVFERMEDCQRVLSVLGKRMERFGLELHPEKTRTVDFRPYRPKGELDPRCQSASFDFLGFTHYRGTTRRGRPRVSQTTAKSRYSRALKSIHQWCKRNRHKPVREQHRMLTWKMRGHYAYYGISGNTKRLRWFAYQVERIWRYWLSRRSRSSPINWERFKAMLGRYALPKPRIVHAW